jgi:mannonate dehydratase
MAGEDNANPGYEILGRLYAIRYLRDMMEAATKCA